MKFYPVIFDILDHDDENENNINEKQTWNEIEEEFNLIYQFDNTLYNMEGDQEEQELIDNENIIVSDNDDDDEEEEDDDDATAAADENDNEVTINNRIYLYPLFFF